VDLPAHSRPGGRRRGPEPRQEQRRAEPHCPSVGHAGKIGRSSAGRLPGPGRMRLRCALRARSRITGVDGRPCSSSRRAHSSGCPEDRLWLARSTAPCAPSESSLQPLWSALAAGENRQFRRFVWRKPHAALGFIFDAGKAYWPTERYVGLLVDSFLAVVPNSPHPTFCLPICLAGLPPLTRPRMFMQL